MVRNKTKPRFDIKKLNFPFSDRILTLLECVPDVSSSPHLMKNYAMRSHISQILYYRWTAKMFPLFCIERILLKHIRSYRPPLSPNRKKHKIINFSMLFWLKLGAAYGVLENRFCGFWKVRTTIKARFFPLTFDFPICRLMSANVRAHKKLCTAPHRMLWHKMRLEVESIWACSKL